MILMETKNRFTGKNAIGTLAAFTLAVSVLGSTSIVPSFAEPTTPSFGSLFYDGEIRRTIVPPARTDKGLDDIYTVTNGVGGQLGIASVAPGDKDYHGGHWTVNIVTFNEEVTPYILTSEEAVLAAHEAGDVSIEWNTDAFICPIQP